MPDSTAELERKLAERDAEVAALADQVERLSHQASPRGRSSSPFSKMPAGIPPPSPRAGSPRGGSMSARGTRPRSASPATRSPRPGSPRGSPGGLSFGSGVKPRKITTEDFFHASMRGGPLTEPLPQRGLTDRERCSPHLYVKGPSLLTRKRFGAKPTEWDKYRDMGDDGEMVNMMEDDNPFNDPFKYHPFKGMAFPPSDYIGPDDHRETDSMMTLPGSNALRLRFVYGYTTRKGCRNNLFYNKEGHIVYHCAALGIVYDKTNHEQWHFHGHDDDITALDINPKDRMTIVSGQLGKDPKILVWSSRPIKGTRTLPQLCIIHGDHKRAIIGLAFNKTGEFIASMGYDNNRSIALYKWGKDKPLEKMRIGVDKGHSDDVYQLCYNPVTDHAVAGGKKFLRFFGLKDGAMSNPEEEARVAAKAGGSATPALSEHESKIWAKKGTFGSKLGAQDVMSLAFDEGGITYAGSGEGMIFRFGEQATDFMVKAHPQPAANYPPGQLCRVTAMHYDTKSKLLYTSGDDGWIHGWDISTWDPNAPGHTPNPKPKKNIDLNQYVLSELKGTIVKMDDKELDKPNPVKGRPAAAHALHSDGKGCLLIGTVCNEIYEVNVDQEGAVPMCYMQGHYDELWGLAMHPSKLEYCTGAEDETLRVWDLDSRTFIAMAKLDGPIRCACYSPDGTMIAVGLGGKQTTHKMNGKWVVLDSKGLSVLHAPKQTRFERVGDIKFSPNMQWIAMAYADNSIDVHAVPGQGNDHKEYRQVAKFEGHSSSINHIDWSSCSTKLQSNCGAHELLYWKLYKPTSTGRRWAPHQEKSSSAMRDVEWHTQTCIFGWPVRGLWPEGADGTDINGVGRSVTGDRDLVVTSDDFGTVKIFRYPCIVPQADNKAYHGHSSHVTNIGFSFDDKWVVSTGGADRGVFQWEVVREELSRG